VTEHPLARLVREALVWNDQQRPRSQQRGPGFSSLGGCARRVWHECRHDEPCNHDLECMAAVMGTALHGAFETAIERYAKLHSLDIRFEVPLRLPAIDLTGSADIVHPPELDDIKTTTLKSLAWYRKHGAPRNNVWQAQAYAMAWNLERPDDPVEHVNLIYIPRDGHFSDVYVYQMPYESDIAEQAVRWFEDIAAADEAPAPEKDDSYCSRFCPFFGELCPGAPRAQDAVHDDPWYEEAAAIYYSYRTHLRQENEGAKAELMEAPDGRYGRYTVRHKNGQYGPYVEVRQA
jgi:hypothetical protein